MNKTTFRVLDDEKTLVMERVFNVEKHKLWEAYTDKNMLAQWWSPTGWETEVKHHDFSEGGYWLYVMKCVDENQKNWFGKTSAGKSVYENISPEDSFEYIDYFTDEEGNINEDMPSSHSVLNLKDNGDGLTTLTIQTTYETEDNLKQMLEMGMEEGYTQTLDKLETLVNK